MVRAGQRGAEKQNLSEEILTQYNFYKKKQKTFQFPKEILDIFIESLWPFPELLYVIDYHCYYWNDLSNMTVIILQLIQKSPELTFTSNLLWQLRVNWYIKYHQYIYIQRSDSDTRSFILRPPHGQSVHSDSQSPQISTQIYDRENTESVSLPRQGSHWSRSLITQGLIQNYLLTTISIHSIYINAQNPQTHSEDYLSFEL